MDLDLNDVSDWLATSWPRLIAVTDLVMSIGASAHAILRKRDNREAVAWVAIIFLAPIVGSVIYLLLGVNRIKRRAQSLRAERGRAAPPAAGEASSDASPGHPRDPDAIHLIPLERLVGEITKRPLVPGNAVVPLRNGDAAYPAMIKAIDAATRSIMISTYIFDNDRAGQQFLTALERAQSRGVRIRVLIDDIGARYSWPTMAHALRRVKIPVARFLPTLVPWRFQYANLRTHRKIMVIDGRVGFTGGINIREGCCLQLQAASPVQDLHFQVTGPVVAQLQQVFVEDWAFSTGELLQGEPWQSATVADGAVVARGIPNGPDDDFEHFRLVLLGAIASARTSIIVVTPYFLPDSSLITALNVAAMRGVQVDIVLPVQNNLPLVQWASNALLWQVLEHGCRIWLSAPPFDHSKLMIVDGLWSVVGSANWDPRSLRLNFEFNLECYDRDLATQLSEIAQAKMRTGRRLTLADIEGRHFLVRLRDGIARLFSPFL